MKTRLVGWAGAGWRSLTEVPGWPDAPVAMRLRRTLPLVIPSVVVLLLLCWSALYHAPRAKQQQAELMPLLELEAEISSLKMISSEEQVAELAERAASAQQLLLQSPDELPEILQTLKQAAAERGWEATFVAADAGGIVPAEGALIGYLPVRGKLVPMTTNQDVFGSFNRLMERFSAPGKRIDLIRLSVRADEHRWQLVELNFRLAHSLRR